MSTKKYKFYYKLIQIYNKLSLKVKLWMFDAPPYPESGAALSSIEGRDG
jgi:hypothetical protein